MIQKVGIILNILCEKISHNNRNIASNFTYSIEVTLQYYISCYDTIHRRYRSAGEMGESGR